MTLAPQADTAHSAALSILIVGYNSAGFLESCIGSIKPLLDQPEFEVLFINNGDDGSEELLANAFPQVRIVPSQGNIGFGRANNCLAKHANGQHLLLLNPDTEASPGAIRALLLAAADHPDHPILGAVTSTERDGSQTLPQMELPGIRTLARGLIGRAARPLSVTQSGGLIPANCVSGGCMMVRREVWERLGGFDEDFFLYGEDIDLCKRASAMGYKLALVPNARIYHDVGSGSYFAPNRLLLQMRGNAHYFRKHSNPAHAAACIAVLWVSAWVRFAAGGLMGLRSEKYRQMSAGFASIALRPWTWWNGYRKLSNH